MPQALLHKHFARASTFCTCIEPVPATQDHRGGRLLRFDANGEAAPVSADPGRRSRLRAEPAPGPLRHRHRRPSSPQRSSGRTPRACTAQPREPAVGTGSGPHGRAADGQGGYFSTRSPTRGLDVLDCAAADGAVRLDDRGSAGGCRVGGSTNTRPMASGCGSSWISTRTRVFRA